VVPVTLLSSSEPELVLDKADTKQTNSSEPSTEPEGTNTTDNNDGVEKLKKIEDTERVIG